MTILPTLASLLVVLSPLAPDDPAPLAKDPRIDASSGRQLATWPPARHFDHLAMTLELDIPDMGKAALSGRLTLDVAAIASPRTVLRLDCNGPVVRQVTSGGKPCEFRLEGRELFITLPSPVPAGGRATVVLDYDLDFSRSKGRGLTHSSGNESAKSLTRQAPQLHAQGQAQLNSMWFPCHDSPNERLSSRLIVTVEEGFDVVSNGRLVSTAKAAPDANGKPRTTWDWFQERPHSPYLVTLAVAKFARIELGGPESARPGLDMPVFTPHGTEDKVRELYAKTAPMMAFFEGLFREPYPWDKYAQCIVRDFAAGGMENTSCTLMTIASSRGEPGAWDDLIAHELAHQWFGNLVTCDSWPHLWLNEGWASFSEALWKEHEASKDGPDKARTAYQRTIRGFYQSQRFRNKTSWPEYTPMVSNRYDDPDNLFSRPEDPYAKGAMLLHMLRQRVGDAAFFDGSAAYLDRHKDGTAVTDDFRRAIEASSGQSLERFFDQWALRPGLPRLSIELSWDEPSKSLSVTLEQTQTIDERNPAFLFTLPIRAKFDDGTVSWMQLEVAGRSAKGVFALPSKPAAVTTDPGMTVMAPAEITKDIAWWIDDSRDPASHHALACAVEMLVQMRAGPDAMLAAIASARLDELEAGTSLSPELAGLVRHARPAMAGAGR